MNLAYLTESLGIKEGAITIITIVTMYLTLMLSELFVIQPTEIAAILVAALLVPVVTKVLEAESVEVAIIVVVVVLAFALPVEARVSTMGSNGVLGVKVPFAAGTPTVIGRVEKMRCDCVIVGKKPAAVPTPIIIICWHVEILNARHLCSKPLM